MDNMEKQMREVLGDSFVDALEGLLTSGTQRQLRKGELVEEAMKILTSIEPSNPDSDKSSNDDVVFFPLEMSFEDVDRRLKAATKGEFVEVRTGVVNSANDMKPADDQALRIHVDYDRAAIAREFSSRDRTNVPAFDDLADMITTMSFNRANEQKLGCFQIAIDCRMNADGSLSFGVVPADEDHSPLDVVERISGEQYLTIHRGKNRVTTDDAIGRYRVLSPDESKVELRPEYKFSEDLNHVPGKFVAIHRSRLSDRLVLDPEAGKGTPPPNIMEVGGMSTTPKRIGVIPYIKKMTDEIDRITTGVPKVKDHPKKEEK